MKRKTHLDAKPEFGLPYAPMLLVRNQTATVKCPVCDARLVEQLDEFGEVLTTAYADHYAAAMMAESKKVRQTT